MDLHAMWKRLVSRFNIALYRFGDWDHVLRFGRFYREDVLGNPEGNDHANIRNFMESGWGGVKFDSPALTIK